MSGSGYCAHEWRFAGRGAPTDGCDRPTVMACVGCGERSEWRCRSSSRALCRPCSTSYKHDVRRIARSGIGVPSGVVFLTLTAPGETAHHLPSGDVCACSANAGPIGEWNAQAGQRWSWLMTYLRRHVDSDAQYFRATEVQERGALHFHVLMRLTPGGLRKLRAMWRPRDPDCHLRRLVVSRGFGHAIDLQVLDGSPEKLARLSTYVAKYVSKSVDARHDTPWTPDPEQPHRRCRARYRTWTASRGYGLKMAELRRAQAAFMRTTGSTPRPVTGRPVALDLPLDPNTDRYTACADAAADDG